MKRPTRIFLIMVLIDFFLLLTALFIMQGFKRDTLEISPLYYDLFKLFVAMWVISSFTMKKYNGIVQENLLGGIILLAKSNLMMTFLIAFAIVGLNLISVSRIQTLGSCALFFQLELAGFSVYYIWAHKGKREKKTVDSDKASAFKDISFQVLIVDGFLLVAAFFVMNYIKRGSFVIPPRYDQVLMTLLAMWLPISLITLKFIRPNFRDFYNSFVPYVKTVAIMASVLAVTLFAFRLFYFSRLQIFGTLLVFLIFEGAMFRMYFLFKKYGRKGEDVEFIEQMREAMGREEMEQSLEGAEEDGPVKDPVAEKLKYTLDFLSPELYGFASEHIDFYSIDRADTSVFSTDNMLNFQSLAGSSLRLFINMHKVNDVRRLNRYFLEVYDKMKQGGYIIGQAHTISTHRQYFVNKYSGYFGELLYGFDFLWRRIFPKLPFFKNIYFSLTQGRNRMVSKAEVLGRLYFCGFSMIAEKEIQNRMFFIAKKTKMPSLKENPTYGPVVSLDRCGFNNEPIKVYKFRTMHPYSEYLQGYVYEKNRLQEGGKFQNDFRVSTWGRFMRENWLDELPMLYNWLRGDMKLFGVRPLSKQYLSLYSDELREIRTTVKPGLVPPFYADLPKNLSEIMDSEMRYIRSYLKDPFKTQSIYLWRSFINIVIKGSRSN